MKANHYRPIALSPDTLLRISATIGIYRALTFLFEDEAQRMLWLKGIHKGPHFDGNSPLRSMLEGGLNGLMSVRRYLDAWCSGNLDSSTHGESFEPVAEHDLIFV
ncbi:antitoxin Xre/MbcA/ParS toxin-binding domain-containing protein [Sulfitobacter sp. PS-8MA]|uniref:antitoxin Xre/MbcA/ParS toxin-binding domain-containing protein n=1 Tax=Sulfitobacter sp. PS-8MA TaxID=3237707 RepID=UPI0034C6AC63